MHGRPRVRGQPDPERVKAAQKKGELLGKLNHAVLTARSLGPADAAALETSAKLLELNPEVYTAWNHRKETLGPILEAGGEAALEAASRELELTQKSLMRNPKSYSAWHHRQWVVEFGLSSLEAELVLVEMLLDLDSRNFHGWTYRRSIARRMGTPAVRELEYTTKKILQNFSNYSAWHYRSWLLPLLSEHGDKEGTQPMHGSSASLLPQAVLAQEFELVSQAFFTEPEDQSAWIYHRWLLGCTMEHFRSAVHEGSTVATKQTRSTVQAVLEEQLDLIKELREAEPGCVWGRKQQAHLLSLLAELTHSDSRRDEAEQALQELKELDPMRRGYFDDTLAALRTRV